MSQLSTLSDAEMRLRSAGLVKSLADEFSAVRAELERYLQERRHRTG